MSTFSFPPVFHQGLFDRFHHHPKHRPKISNTDLFQPSWFPASSWAWLAPAGCKCHSSTQAFWRRLLCPRSALCGVFAGDIQNFLNMTTWLLERLLVTDIFNYAMAQDTIFAWRKLSLSIMKCSLSLDFYWIIQAKRRLVSLPSPCTFPILQPLYSK